MIESGLRRLSRLERSHRVNAIPTFVGTPMSTKET
jgi:hypothetical protein